MDAVKVLDEGANVEDVIARADRARDEKDWDSAVRNYRDALDIDDGMAHIWVQYGHALKESHRYDDAEGAYQAALVIDDRADTHLQLGHLHKIAGRLRDAEEDYLCALERQPGLADARAELTRMGWSGARLEARITRGGLASVESLIRCADNARDAKDWDNAARYYCSALDIDSGMANVWVLYGHVLKELRRYDDAEGAYQKALEIEDLADTHMQLGHLHKITGRRREAEGDYLRALEREPHHSDARAELTHMGWTGARLRARMPQGGSAPFSTDQLFIAFELSDLIDHLQRARYPTGIQRVQLELGAAFVKAYGEERVQFIYYDHLQSNFYEVSRELVLAIVDLVEVDEHDEERRKKIVDELKTDIVEAPSFDFPPGAFLVSVGTSWGFLNYFLTIRDFKRRRQIRYVPLVHDCIPLLFPEFCNPNLVSDFINWISQMIGHADLILTNSENTRKDVCAVADDLDAGLPPIATIRLNGEYRNHLAALNSDRDRAAQALLSRHNLDVEDFVLFVSTIEPRKNHTLALNAWSRMLKTRSAGAVPRLVCVGSGGWMNEGFHQRLERDRVLRERVVVLQDVSDEILRALYKRCMFTIFPSLYEGWGLPISEALAYGKVPLVSRVSSHPEAGGDHAVYFDLCSESDFDAKLKTLIHDVPMRRALEMKIATTSPLRPWREIADEIVRLVETQPPRPPAEAAAVAKGSPAIVCGRYYSFARNTAPTIQTMEHSGEIYRAGTNWHAPEPFGCWIRGSTADIGFSLTDEQADDFTVYLHWVGSSNIDNGVVLSVPPGTWRKRVSIPRGHRRWDVVPIRFGAASKREVRIRITAETVDDFAKASEGQDRRLASVGVSGLYVCRTSDSLQRMAIIEAMQLGDLSAVARRFASAPVL